MKHQRRKHERNEEEKTKIKKNEDGDIDDVEKKEKIRK